MKTMKEILESKNIEPNSFERVAIALEELNQTAKEAMELFRLAAQGQQPEKQATAIEELIEMSQEPTKAQSDIDELLAIQKTPYRRKPRKNVHPYHPTYQNDLVILPAIWQGEQKFTTLLFMEKAIKKYDLLGRQATLWLPDNGAILIQMDVRNGWSIHSRTSKNAAQPTASARIADEEVFAECKKRGLFRKEYNLTWEPRLHSFIVEAAE